MINEFPFTQFFTHTHQKVGRNCPMITNYACLQSQTGKQVLLLVLVSCTVRQKRCLETSWSMITITDRQPSELSCIILQAPFFTLDQTAGWLASRDDNSVSSSVCHPPSKCQLDSSHSNTSVIVSYALSPSHIHTVTLTHPQAQSHSHHQYLIASSL